MSTRYPKDPKNALSIDDGPAPQWWTSPDIWVNAPGGTVANMGDNTVFLRVHLAGQVGFDDNVAIGLFVGNPSFVMTPTTGTAQIGSTTIKQSSFPPGGGTFEATVKWNVTVDPLHPDGPAQPGHRCLIARVYPDNSALPNDFQVPTDQHEAQRNICVVKCDKIGQAPGGVGAGMRGTPQGAPMGPGRDGLWAFRLQTTSPFEEGASKATLRATWAPKLDPGVLGGILPALEGTGFTGFAAAPPKTFLIDAGAIARHDEGSESAWIERLEDCLHSVWSWIRARLGKTTGVGRHTSEVGVTLAPGQAPIVDFQLDMRSTPPGQAQVFHLEQIGGDGGNQGGITLVFVSVA